MKYELAEEILKGTMTHWDILKMTDETKDIQIISEIKYDDYLQYTHGMRYIESLALWMRQFESPKDKDCAYELVKNELIFVSEEEMRQLIAYAYPLKIKGYLIEKTKEFCRKQSIKEIKIRKEIYGYFKRSSLFLGLSDGAHMDYFRRKNIDLSNEQIFIHYDFSKEKANDMIEKMEEDFSGNSLLEKYKVLPRNKFNSYFLLDDFTGSGRSFIRKEDGEWHGKIPTFYKQLDEVGYNAKDADVHLIIYIATEKAKIYIEDQLNLFLGEKGCKKITVEVIQSVSALNWEDHFQLAQLLEKNYNSLLKKHNNSYVDKHFKVGEGEKPYFGFADCSLPLILYHNTPNNSLPILWYSWKDEEDALFERVTRHKEQ